ncbi:hypothetical protein BDD12DRAFT_862626 [Trichophaea hybrida]|nr:hypothetical protein BDD12DRAFT_862626 [Trichophaea hybrida]
MKLKWTATHISLLLSCRLNGLSYESTMELIYKETGILRSIASIRLKMNALRKEHDLGGDIHGEGLNRTKTEALLRSLAGDNDIDLGVARDNTLHNNHIYTY